jgi:hypothetical protein
MARSAAKAFLAANHAFICVRAAADAQVRSVHRPGSADPQEAQHERLAA